MWSTRTRPRRCARRIEHRFPEAQVSLSSQFAQDTDPKAQMDAFTAAIGILAMLVGGIVVANTMMMSIYERTREIGTLRALGWPKRRILGQVMQESLWLCLVAGAAGLGAGGGHALAAQQGCPSRTP